VYLVRRCRELATIHTIAHAVIDLYRRIPAETLAKSFPALAKGGPAKGSESPSLFTTVIIDKVAYDGDIIVRCRHVNVPWFSPKVGSPTPAGPAIVRTGRAQ
jgi:hypothetical protein